MVGKSANPAWAIAEYLWYPILIFAATPYFLKTLGPERYGLWMLLTATVGLGTVINTGTGAATIKLVSEHLGRGDPSMLKSTVGSALAFSLVGGGCLAVFTLGVFVFGGDLLFDKMGDRRLIQLTGLSAAILTWVEQIDNALASAIRGAEKFGRIARLEMASKTLQMGLALLAVGLGGGLEVLYVVLMLNSLVRLIAKGRLARDVLGVSSFRPRFGHAHEFLRLSKWGWLQGMGAMLFNSADRFVVGSLFGAATLSHYAVILMLPQQIHAIAAAGLSVLFPMISRRNARDPSFSVAKSTLMMMIAAIALSSGGAGFLWFFGDRIFSIWLDVPLPIEALQAYRYLVVAYFILALNVFPHYVLLGFGKIRFVALSNVVAGCVTLAVMVTSGHEFGLIGIGACRVLYAVIACVNFVPLFLHIRHPRPTV